MDRGDMAPVTVLVDTSAGHTMLPASLLNGLRIEPMEYQTFTLPVHPERSAAESKDGNQIEYGVAMARIAIDGRQWPCPVIFGPEDVHLLGATTLETFRLTIDPFHETLIPQQYRARPI